MCFDVFVFFFKDGWTALHFSAHSGHLPVVKQLIESGTNLVKETNVCIVYIVRNIINYPEMLLDI